MSEIQESPRGALVPYERGLPLSKTLRATVQYFAPGAGITVTAGLLLVLEVPRGAEWIESLLMVGGSVGILSLGFFTGLEALRRWLYPDAEVDGRRSFVAGLLSPLAVFITGILSTPRMELAALGILFLPSVILALLMFFAWLSPTPEELRGEEYDWDHEGVEPELQETGL